MTEQDRHAVMNAPCEVIGGGHDQTAIKLKLATPFDRGPKGNAEREGEAYPRVCHDQGERAEHDGGRYESAVIEACS